MNDSSLAPRVRSRGVALRPKPPSASRFVCEFKGPSTRLPDFGWSHVALRPGADPLFFCSVKCLFDSDVGRPVESPLVSNGLPVSSQGVGGGTIRRLTVLVVSVRPHYGHWGLGSSLRTAGESPGEVCGGELCEGGPSADGTSFSVEVSSRGRRGSGSSVDGAPEEPSPGP